MLGRERTRSLLIRTTLQPFIDRIRSGAGPELKTKDDLDFYRCFVDFSRSYQGWLVSHMYVEFEYTKEDLVDVAKRCLKRRNPKKADEWKASLYLGVSVAVILFFVLKTTPLTGVVTGLIAASVILLYQRWLRSSLENRMRQIADELMAAPGPYVCEVELRPEGLWLRQMDKQTIYEWKSLEAIEETADSVDIFSRDGGGVVVRNRAFSSETDRSRFIEMVRSGLSESAANEG